MAKRKTKRSAKKAAPAPAPKPAPQPAAPKAKKDAKPKPKVYPPWSEFVRDASHTEITNRASRELKSLIRKAEAKFPNTCFVLLLDSGTSISNFELDRIYQSLTTHNKDRSKDVTLIIQSPGGEIEPAYQISKVCKAFAKEKFRVVVPRYAKSAATLISLGADEIHMGPLSHLGPIDPQIGGLPALGVARALTTIAELSEAHPGSAEMFSKYLNQALTVEQIGYCERISESAEQYAQRLLATKENLPRKGALIAKELVHEYKDHGFVIDVSEAQEHLGDHWVLDDTPLLGVGEDIYTLYELITMYVRIYKKRKVLVIGDPGTIVLAG